MFELQIEVAHQKWLPIGDVAEDEIPNNVDALWWLRKQFPATNFRVARSCDARLFTREAGVRARRTLQHA